MANNLIGKVQFRRNLNEYRVNVLPRLTGNIGIRAITVLKSKMIRKVVSFRDSKTTVQVT